MQFSHEKLIAYQRSIQFVGWVGALLEGVSSGAAVKNQLDRASTSVPLNIAEGNGKFSNRDRCRFLQIAHGSAVESAACLDVMVARGLVDEGRILEGKKLLHEVVNLLHGLLTRFQSRRVEEAPAQYGEDSGLGVEEEDD